VRCWAGSQPRQGEATPARRGETTRASRPDAATKRLALHLTILPPSLPPNGTGRRLGGRSRVRAKEPVRGLSSRSFRPTGTRPHLPGNDTPALTWDFAYELNTRPSPCTGRGPRIGRRKTRLTCGAPLRNRTVDLLLTMDRCAVLQPQVDSLTCANTSTRWHSQAPDEPTRAPFATQSATHFDLALSNSTAIETSASKSNSTDADTSSPTLTVAVPGYRFNSFMSHLPVTPTR
jgi:hypothetical protein